MSIRMKIKTVEIPIEEYHDGSDSTESDTFDNSSNHRVVNFTSAAVPATTESYEKTMGMFAVALTELQTELRDKTNECEALYETARSLSQALQESDRLLQNKTLECERLSLKLQMVTFRECDVFDPFGFDDEEVVDFDKADRYDGDEYYEIPQRPEAILDQLQHTRHYQEGSARHSHTTKPRPESIRERDAKKRFLNKVVGNESSTKISTVLETIDESLAKVTLDDEVSVTTIADDEGSEKQEHRGSVSSGPVCVDDCDDDDDMRIARNPVSVDDDQVAAAYERQVLTRVINDGKSQVVIGPSQAHFYHVILERDMAKQTISKLTRDLRYARCKLRELKTKLEQSNALLELTYDNQRIRKGQDIQQQSNTAVSKKSTKLLRTDVDVDSHDEESCERLRSLPWRRSYGISSTSRMNRDKKNALNVTEEYVSFISDEEMLSKNWNKTSGKALDAAATEEYLKVMLTPGDDADRAGGGRRKIASQRLDV